MFLRESPRYSPQLSRDDRKVSSVKCQKQRTRDSLLFFDALMEVSVFGCLFVHVCAFHYDIHLTNIFDCCSSLCYVEKKALFPFKLGYKFIQQFLVM